MNILLSGDNAFFASYNCTFYSVDEIPVEKRRHTAVGVSFIFLFVVFETIYLPCMWVMLQEKYLRESCYKLMLLLGIWDMLNMPFSGLLTGYFAIVGDVYCSRPTVIYISGMISVGLWGAGSMTNVILALNRCLAVWNQTAVNCLFYGNRVYLWMGFTVAYGLIIVWFTPPLLFSSLRVGWFYNPHFGYYDDFEQMTYINNLHAVHNTGMAVMMLAIYGVFFVRLRKRLVFQHSSIRQLYNTPSAQRRLRKQNIRISSTFLQVFIITVLHSLAALSYVYMQFVPVTMATALIGSYTWLILEGLTPVIYLTFNASMNSTLRRICHGLLSRNELLDRGRQRSGDNALPFDTLNISDSNKRVTVEFDEPVDEDSASHARA